MKKILLLLICVILYGEDLKSLLEYANTNNDIVASKTITEQAKQKELESSQNSFYPTIDLGSFYQRLDNDRTPMQSGDIYSGYAKIGVDLYDGGRKKSIIEQNRALLNSSKYATSAYKKSLQLDITQDFFAVLSAKESLKALEDKKTQLQAEVARVKKLYEVGSVTNDDVEKLQAALSNVVYQEDNLKYQIHALKRGLSIKVGKNVKNLKTSSLKESINIQKSLSDDTLILKQQAKSLQFIANGLNSAYKPQIRLEDTYSLYGYRRSDTYHPEGMDHQNKLMLNFSIRVFDNDVITKQKESILLQKRALAKQIEQSKNIQNINIELATSKIQTVKAQIKSAKTSLLSATSTYKTVAKKFEAGIVNNVAYLDALSVKTNAKAQYETALNNLQVAYASYYYYTNKNIKDFIK
ncbi:MAG: TolC family protein [Epsilonproteobacteria bacterium]|nr:TolC family protein [Campylobacterota bacterium]